MWQLLFTGGIITKLAMIGLLVGMMGMGVSCTSKEVQLKLANSKVTKLETANGQLSTDNTTLKHNNKILKDDLNKAIDVNKTTVDANNKLLQERKDAQIAIANLAAANAKSKDELDKAKRKIEDMLKDPKNDGPIAPVLREIIRDIQERSK